MAAGANGGEVRARLTLDNSQFTKNMADSRSQMSDLDKQAANNQRGFDQIQRTAKVAGIAVAAMGAASVTTAARFEQGMARVQAVSGATGSEFNALEDAAREAGATTVFSATDASDALGYLSMAGFDATESMAALPNVLNLASAAQVDLGRSADIVSNIMTGFGLTAEETDRAVDVLTETMTTANTDLPQLGDAMKFVAPVAESLGWSIEETSAAIGKMSDAGIQGGKAGTALRAALLSLANPTGQTADAMEELGINVEDAEGQMLPLPELIGEVSEKFDGMTDTQKTAYAQMLVGREAASGFLAIMKESPESMQEYITSLENSEGAAQRLSDIQNDTLIGSSKEFLSALEEMGIAVGDELLPALKDFVEMGTGMVRTINDVNPKLIAMGLKFTAGASAAVLAVGAVKKLRTALKALQLMSGPLGWISLLAGALGGVAAASLGASEETEKLQEVNLEGIKQMGEEERALNDKISRYEDLRSKSENTNEVLGEFIDIQGEINRTADDDRVSELEDAQAGLAEKAGYTVDELAEMAELNGDFVANNSEVITAYSEQGDAIAGNTEKLREQQKQLLENMAIELDKEMEKARENANKLANDYSEFYEDWNANARQYNEAKEKEAELEKDVSQSRDDYNELLESGKVITAGQLEAAQQIYLKNEEDLETTRNKKDTAMETLDGMKEEKETIDEQIQSSREVFNEALNIQLAQAGINAEGEKGLAQLDDTLAKEAERFLELENIKNKKGELNSKQQEEYEKLSESLTLRNDIRERIGTILSAQSEVNGSLDEATGKSRDMVDLLTDDYTVGVNGLDDPLDIARSLSGELDQDHDKTVSIYDTGLTELIRKASRGEDKTVSLKESGLATLNSNARAQVTKNVLLNPINRVNSVLSGIRHAGGTVHELPKYHDGGNIDKPHDQENASGRLSSFLPPKHNEVDVRLLRNEMVLTKGQQANLFRMIDNYNGMRSSQQSIIDLLKNGTAGKSGTGSTNGEPIVLQVNLDGRQVAESTYKDMSELLERQKRQYSRNMGGRR